MRWVCLWDCLCDLSHRKCSLTRAGCSLLPGAVSRATGWATLALPALQEPMDLGIPSAMKNRRAGVGVELTAKGNNWVWTCCSWVILQLPASLAELLLITYQPVLGIFDNFLVSVFFFCTSSDLAQGKRCYLQLLPLQVWPQLPGRLFCPAGISTPVFLPAFLLMPLDTLKPVFWKLSTFLEIECQKILFCILFCNLGTSIKGIHYILNGNFSLTLSCSD